MKKLIIITAVALAAAVISGGEQMKKSRYIDLMEKTLTAYSLEHIERYYNDVKRDGLKEQGYPRLTSNIGILIAHGRRQDIKPLFVKMMDLCCEEIPKHKAVSNEFSIKEVIFCLLELEKHRTFPQSQIDKWKAKFKEVTVENCYRKYATAPDTIVNNWAAFTMVSEWMRYKINAAPMDMQFINNQAASQLQFVDENGMYRDPNEPMVYDMVTRGLMALLFHQGYRDKYFKQWDDALTKAGLHTLKMVSVTGELPYGGRSNQFLHNESHVAIILEYEAARYARLGNMELAGKCKAAVKRALDNIELWLSEQPINHVKNAFPRSTSYGCETYAYFDKYMITTASFMYVAYLLSDDSIPCGKFDDVTGESFRTSEHFHKVFLRAGDYFAEYDYRADYHYDAYGLGRLHRKGAPSTIAISVPGTDAPKYVVDIKDAQPFAIVPEILSNGKWLSGAESTATHKVISHGAEGEKAFASIKCIMGDDAETNSSYLLDKNGLKVTVEGNGKVGLRLPAFAFDGRDKTEIKSTENSLEIKYRNWVCRYQTSDGKITDTGKYGCNRNGHYKLFRAEADKKLTVTVTITPAK